jgi:hypothetical protein
VMQALAESGGASAASGESDEVTQITDDMFDGLPLDDDLFEVEAPPEREVAESVKRAAYEGKVAAARAKARQEAMGRFPGWQLRFVGIYGIVIMIGAALMGLASVVVTILTALDKRVGLESGLALLLMAAFQAAVYFVLFRMGQGLVASQRSAVKGLIVLYVVFMIIGAANHFAYGESGMVVGIYAGLISALLLPPILVAFTSWSDFHETND